jgi:hypothetical protein
MKDITKNHNATLKKLNINGKVIPSRTSHKGTQNSRKKWGGFIKRRCTELNSPLRHYICLNMYQNYGSFKKIMLSKMVYMSMGT